MRRFFYRHDDLHARAPPCTGGHDELVPATEGSRESRESGEQDIVDDVRVRTQCRGGHHWRRGKGGREEREERASWRCAGTSAAWWRG